MKHNNIILKKIFTLIIICLSYNSFSNLIYNTLSYESEISVLTCGSGKELYSLFGHTAIRVKDPIKKFDYVFNYGVFNFSTPNFYWKFGMGNLDYYIDYSTYKRFIHEYTHRKRNVYEQKMNLTYTQKQKIFDFLLNNIQPQNKYYRYKFVKDNCSTRIRDVFTKNLGNQIQFKDNKSNYTYWNLLDHYLINDSYSRMLIYIILGSPMNKKAGYFQEMFLPDYLLNAFNTATININNTKQKLVRSTKLILSFQNKKEKPKYSAFTLSLFFFIFILLISLLEIKFKFRAYLIDYLIFIPTFALGLIICFLWFISNHTETAYNLNIIWACPINLIALILIKKNFGQTFFKVYSVVLIITIVCWFWLPQSMPISMLPFAIVVLIRSILLGYKNKLNFKKLIK